LTLKKNINDLALLGGKPLFESPRPIGQLALPDEETFFSYIGDIYKHKRITNNGPLARELENRLARLHGVEYCLVFANASLALILLMKVLSRGSQGEVIMPAFTYSGLPHLSQWAGQYPRFCDIDRDTHTLDPEAVANSVTHSTTVILAVHQVNSPCHVDELHDISEQNDVPLLFDSVHGIHCHYNGKPLGGFGKAEVFSLHATKLLNGFEGGYVTTSDPELTEVLRKIRNFGIDEYGNVDMLGLNAKLNEIHAAMALACLDSQDDILSKNKERVALYNRYFETIPGLDWIPYQSQDMNFEFALLYVPPDWPITRDDLVRMLRAENALARAYYSPPLHLSSHCPADMKPPNLPVTEELSGRIIQMPAGELVNEKDISILSDFTMFAYKNSDEINFRIKAAE